MGNGFDGVMWALTESWHRKSRATQIGRLLHYCILLFFSGYSAFHVPSLCIMVETLKTLRFLMILGCSHSAQKLASSLIAVDNGQTRRAVRVSNSHEILSFSRG